ncbi:hypothetical protein N7532_004294 [Penicillium argentinense]|uniref:Uncharacterized protein n=1 Tax=Penicillium argentinense TaxID=1131581 RepID=A0A9W9FP47_9EURO|nr:uncharacterized protein N7532_004294 [Penicillium argentinense]KAJ5103765.1 hypothetical protein N7532_004294 [Penicillium argentinense]
MSTSSESSGSPGSPNGTALIWIFDHCLRYPGTYEIPLRTMYTINCNPTKTSISSSRSAETAFSPRNSTSTKSSRSSDSSIDAAADFRSQLIHQISNLPTQPCSLPASFLTSFLRRCFTPKLENVDFPQALAAVDYLRDLENRWKKEFEAALKRLGFNREDAEKLMDPEMRKQYPGVIAWIQTMSTKARTVEALYTQIYVGLRRWILINDLLLEPQNKVNHIAMLNTLYPPVTDATMMPTPQLTRHILKKHRDGFFNYINAVANRGKEALDPVISQGAPEGEETSWPLVHDSLERYLDQANEIIDECLLVTEPSHLAEDGSPHRHKNRKVDSGISFGSSTTDVSIGEDVTEKPLPQFPVPKNNQDKPGSFLERIARERPVQEPQKMKSSTTLNARPGSQQSYAESSFFEIDEQKRRRLIGEATRRKYTQSNASSSS